MRRFLLAGTALLGFAASGSVATAGPIEFDSTGSLIDFTVPATGDYQILAFGAQGGSGTGGLAGGGPPPFTLAQVAEAPRSAATSS